MVPKYCGPSGPFLLYVKLCNGRTLEFLKSCGPSVPSQLGDQLKNDNLLEVPKYCGLSGPSLLNDKLCNSRTLEFHKFSGPCSPSLLLDQLENGNLLEFCGPSGPSLLGDKYVGKAAVSLTAKYHGHSGQYVCYTRDFYQCELHVTRCNNKITVDHSYS